MTASNWRAGVVLSCYYCDAIDAVEIATCLRPVARRANTITCPGTVQDGYYCAKFVWKTVQKLKGQILRTWEMYRVCITPFTQDFYFGRRLTCGECVRVNGRTRYYTRGNTISEGLIPYPYEPEEVNAEHRSICTCCTDLCNADEGFNLSKLDQLETQTGDARNGDGDGMGLQLGFGHQILMVIIVVFCSFNICSGLWACSGAILLFRWLNKYA